MDGLGEGPRAGTGRHGAVGTTSRERGKGFPTAVAKPTASLCR